MQPTIAQLRIVDSVARARSFTVAALECQLSQPALSRSVQDVERQLGSRLFERTTRSVELTPDGRAFLEVARDILSSYDNGLGRFAAYRAADLGAVTIAALPSVAAGRLPAVLARFAAEHPAVSLRVLDGDHAEVLDFLRSGAADLAITEEPPGEADLGVRVLYNDPIVALLPRTHELAELRSVTWLQLAHVAFVLLSPGSSVARLTDAGFAAAGARPRHVINTRTVSIAGGLVRAGLGVTTVTESVFPLVASKDVVSRPVVAPQISRRLAALYRISPAITPAARALLELIRRDVESDAETGR